MRSRLLLARVALSIGALTVTLAGQAPARHRLNSVIELLEVVEAALARRGKVDAHLARVEGRQVDRRRPDERKR